MVHGPRLLLAGFCALALLSGCEIDSQATSSGGAAAVTTGTGTNPPSTNFGSGSTLSGTKDTVTATLSVSGTVSTVVGGARTVSLTFTSSDGRPITGFALAASLDKLPAGWSGPSTFACAALSTGNDCVLNLTYAPTAAGSGMVAIQYEFIDDATQPKTGGSVSFAYASTASNNIVASASSTGQVSATLNGGSQSVNVNFITDDGKAATQLTLTTDLQSLPAGWSAGAGSLPCAIVSTGNGCQLGLTYAPTAAGSGTLTLAYAYVDASGAAKTGAINISYAATTVNDVIALVSPSGQVLAVRKTGGRAVAITFTDDGKPASGLAVSSNLASLPSGWKSGSTAFSCATVGTGNGCQLSLTYAPTDLSSGTLSLSYAYQDGSGAARTGLLNVDYAATTNDTVSDMESPPGQLTTIIADGSMHPGSGNQSVTISFTTSDGRPATALTVTSDLSALPPGWTSAVPSFGCTGLNVDTQCLLTLTYAPTLAGSGTLMVNYAYRNNAGDPGTGVALIHYRATVNDSVSAVASPSTLPQVRTGSGAIPITVSFTTDDGNPASVLSVTGLNALPADWSSAATSFTCATVSAGSDCVLSLSYTPTVAVASGTVTLGFTYLNDALESGSGTIMLNYSASTPYLYVASSGSTQLSACPLNFDNSLGACTATASGIDTPIGIALNGSYVYVTDSGSSNTVSRCLLSSAGTLTNCTSTGAFSAPASLAIKPADGTSATAFAYVGQGAGITACALSSSDGSLSSCAATAAAFDPFAGLALSADAHAYTAHGSAIAMCTVALDGTFSNCAGTTASTPLLLAVLGIQNAHLYASATDGSVYVCTLNTDASVGGCQSTAAGTHANGIALAAATSAGTTPMAYLSNGSGSVSVCTVGTSGTLGGCSAFTDTSLVGATTAVALRSP